MSETLQTSLLAELEQEKKTHSLYARAARYLLYVLLIFTPLARGSVHNWHHTVIEIFAVSMLSLLLLEKAVTDEPKYRKTVMDLPIIALVVLVLISTFFSQAIYNSIEALGLLISYVVIFYCVIYSIRTRSDVIELVYVLCGMALLLTTIGLLKSGGITPSIWLYEELRYSKVFVSGVFGNYNHMAGYLEMVLPLFLVLFLTRTRSGWIYSVMLLVGFYLVAGHLLTLSRGGWFSLAIALLFMAAILMFHKRFHSKKLLLLIISSCFVVLFFILSGTDLFLRALTLTDENVVMGMNGRVLIWKGTLSMIQQNAFIGTGPGTFASVFPQFQPPGSGARYATAHNDYLHYLAELGLLVIPLAGWALIVLFRTGFKKLGSSSRQTWGITLGCMTGIVAILAHSLVDFNLHIPSNAIVFIVLIALVVGGPKTSKRSRT